MPGGCLPPGSSWMQIGMNDFLGLGSAALIKHRGEAGVPLRNRVCGRWLTVRTRAGPGAGGLAVALGAGVLGRGRWQAGQAEARAGHRAAQHTKGKASTPSPHLSYLPIHIWHGNDNGMQHGREGSVYPVAPLLGPSPGGRRRSSGSGATVGHQGWAVPIRAGEGCDPLAPGAREDKGLGSVTPRARPTGAAGLPTLDFWGGISPSTAPSIRQTTPPPRRTSPMLPIFDDFRLGCGK